MSDRKCAANHDLWIGEPRQGITDPICRKTDRPRQLQQGISMKKLGVWWLFAVLLLTSAAWAQAAKNACAASAIAARPTEGLPRICHQ